MKILVIGGSGLIGSHMIQAARGAGHDVAGTFRRHFRPGLLALDCGDAAAVERLLEQAHPDAVVHSAGMTWADACEEDPHRAREENAAQPAQVAELCAQRNIHFTFISSSYVFDGRHGPYREDDPPNPISVYGRTKLEGEQRVTDATGGSALIARVIWVFGAEARGKNFACQVLRAMREGQTLTVPSDQCGNPTYAGDIARWWTTLAAEKARGIWHLAGPQPDCPRPLWATMLVAAFEAAGVKPHANFKVQSLPTSELKQKAPRPLRAGLITAKAGPKGFKPTPMLEAIRLMLAADSPAASHRS